MQHPRHPLLSASCAFMTAAVATAQEQKVESPIAGEIGIDVASQYFFRGILQEDQGFIVQPWVELGMPLMSSNEIGVGGLGLVLGLWNSLHSGPSGTGSNSSGTGGNGQAWYESDFYFGVESNVSEQVAVQATYTAYASPNGVFGTVEEVLFSGSFDDSSLWGEEFGGLQPSATVAFELDGQADGGAGRGVYLELGIGPGFTVHEGASLSLALPVTVGLSLGDYFESATGDDTFGFVDVGAVLSMPLQSMAARYGPWNASLGVHLLSLGDNMEAINGGDAFEAFVSFGLSTSF